MKFVAKEIKENVNISNEHPFKEVAWMLATVTVLLIAAYIAIGVLSYLLAPMVSFERERAWGRELRSKEKQKLSELDQRRQKWLQAKVDQLCAQQPEITASPDIFLIQSGMLNAFMAPGAQMGVTTGLLDTASSENELIFVMAHELGHYYGRDAIRGLGRFFFLMALAAGLGLGGADKWEHHVEETLRVLNAVEPEFVRFRRLWIYGAEGGPQCPLLQDVQEGRFLPQAPEGTVLEMRAILDGIRFSTEVEAIHGNVYVRMHGTLPEQREKLLGKIDRFLARPQEERAAWYARPSTI